jgi:hypothetical protein
MTEDYLHYIWKHRLFDGNGLTTENRQPITIIHPGNPNPNAGPDFLEAKVKIGEEVWAGHIELHVRSSDWQKHNHQTDKAYNNVVLHVVYAHDAPAFRESGTALPTLELKGRFDEMGYWRYEQFIGNKRYLACENVLNTVDEIHKETMLNRALVERLQQKAESVSAIYEQCGNDWNEAFYHMLLYSFGLKVNAETMLVLASRLPLSIIRKHAGNAFQVEALLMGMAGLLSGQDDYANALQKEFEFLRKKYSLHPLQEKHFKFARLRPIGFPTVRLAQLSAILSAQTELFRLCIESENSDAIKSALQAQPAEYWQTHYTLGKISAAKEKRAATTLVNLVMINAVVPCLFAYADKTGKEDLKERAMQWLLQLPAEENSIAKNFAERGFVISSAYQSQAVLQLYKNFCRQRNCLTCAIGVKLLRS